MIQKSLSSGFATRSALVIGALGLLAGAAEAQQSRISKAVDNQERFVLRGNVHPKARPEDDQGRVAPSFSLSYVTLVLAQSDSQRADLAQLLLDQQNPNSPNYHHWLTPEQYADRFGVSTDDLTKMTAWLESQGLTIASVARARNWIAVNGDASRIESAFQTEIHEYLTDGAKTLRCSTGTLRTRGLCRSDSANPRAERFPDEGQTHPAQSSRAPIAHAPLHCERRRKFSNAE